MSLPSFQSWDDIVFVGKFLPEDASGHQRYRSLAQQYRDRFSFGIHMNSAKDRSEIRCWNNLDDEEHVLTELWRVEAYETFVRMCAEPLIPELNRRNEGDINQVTRATYCGSLGKVS